MSTSSNEPPISNDMERDRLSALSDKLDKLTSAFEKKKTETVAIIASITAALAVMVSGINVYLSHEIERTKLVGGPVTAVLQNVTRGVAGEPWVEIRLKDGPRYAGWPRYFGVKAGPSQIFLAPACELKGTDGVLPIDGGGLIVYEERIETIALVDRSEHPCPKYWLKPENRAKATKWQPRIE